MQTFLSQKSDADGLASGAITTLNSSVLLPLEKIGENLHGKMANLQVYNQALSAEEAAEYYTDDWSETTVKTNVAQNKAAGGTSYKSGDAVDNAERRINVALRHLTEMHLLKRRYNSEAGYKYFRDEFILERLSCRQLFMCGSWRDQNSQRS